MRVSMLVRWGATVAGLGLLVVGCSDTPTIPSPATSPPTFIAAPTSPALARAKQRHEAIHVKTFTVDPTRTKTYKFGPHSVTFPAYSICDPSTSGYGEGMWDAPCDPLRTEITITATYMNNAGHSFVDFQPALRFVPAGANETDRWVVLSLKDGPVLADKLDGYQILWERPSTGEWVNEAATDPSLSARSDRNGNTVSRRVKHFSGYNVTAGFVGECTSYLTRCASGLLNLLQ